jgi:hypothetical protein
MTYWQTNQIPYSWNPKNITLSWSGSDAKENLEKNKDRDYWKNIDISYVYNVQGFRTYNLTDLYEKKINVALGCSLTEGIALPINWTWPTLLEEKTDLPMLNLGLGGGSTDTVARILSNISGMYNIQTVYILWPHLNRFEIAYPSGIRSMTPHNPNFDIKYMWNMDQDMLTNRFEKNQFIIHLLSKQFKYIIKELTVDQATDTFFRAEPVTGRDGMHWGLPAHQKIAEYFLTT